MPELSREAQILLHSARPIFDETARAALENTLAAATDWRRLIGLAKRHGLIPLLYRRLKDLGPTVVPPQVLSEINLLAHEEASFALLLTGELRALLELLTARGIPALPYKGPALSVQLYGKPTLRHFNDLDVLIRPADLLRAQNALQAHGWKTETLFQGARQRLFERHYDSYPYYRANILLELHWSLVERRFAFPLTVEELLERARPLTLSGREILAPAPEDTLLMLCFHGAKHLWERFAWLCDVAQLLATQPALDWDITLQRARRLGCERVLWLSLSLAREYLAAPLPAAVTRHIEADTTARALAAQVASHWFLPAAYNADNLTRAQFHLQMRERWRERALYRQRFYFRITPDDWALLPFALPRPLLFLYAPLRWARMLGKYVLPD